jgi:glycosyltransferase involved in cell wall biosynthesis
MRILHIATFDIYGGAARAAFRVHKSLINSGHESSFFVSRSSSGDGRVKTFIAPSDISSRVQRILRRKSIQRHLAHYRETMPKGYEAFSTDRSEHGGTVTHQLPQCDVINLHWIAGFVDYSTFFDKVPQNTPVVWTFHDMNPFTGGCHYDENCGKHEKGCGTCPQLGSCDLKDLSYKTWRRKQRILGRVPPERLKVVAPSQWLAQLASQSPLFKGFRVRRIPYGVDLEDFRSRDKFMARDLIGIPHTARVILFVSDWMTNRRKGLTFLMECLAQLRPNDDLLLLSMGRGGVPENHGIRHLALGHIQGDRFLSLVYSAADLFVIPSMQDNLPNTVLEALACGTPVIGFDTGGIPDMVRPGVTGLLVPAGSSTALKSAILTLIYDRDARQEMSLNCRRIAEDEYSLENQAREYIRLYEQILGR